MQSGHGSDTNLFPRSEWACRSATHLTYHSTHPTCARTQRRSRRRKRGRLSAGSKAVSPRSPPTRAAVTTLRRLPRPWQQPNLYLENNTQTSAAAAAGLSCFIFLSQNFSIHSIAERGLVYPPFLAVQYIQYKNQRRNDSKEG